MISDEISLLLLCWAARGHLPIPNVSMQVLDSAQLLFHLTFFRERIELSEDLLTSEALDHVVSFEVRHDERGILLPIKCVVNEWLPEDHTPHGVTD